MTHPIEVLKFLLLVCGLMFVVFGLAEFLVWLGCLIKTLVRLLCLEWKLSIYRRRNRRKQ